MDLFLARSFHLNYCLNVSENNGKRQREYVNNKKCASFAFGIWNSFTKRRQIVGCLILKGLRRVVAQKKKKKTQNGEDIVKLSNKLCIQGKW